MVMHGSPSSSVRPDRFAALTAAVELEVDEDDMAFESSEEQLLWESLREDFQAFVAKIGPVWIADR